MLKFNHVHIKGPDPKKTAQWYIDVFGARTIEEFLIRGAPTIAMDLCGVRINITGLAPGQKLPSGSAKPHLGLEHICVETDDLEPLVAKLKARGAEVLDAPPPAASGAQAVFIRAPDNVRIEVLKPARR
ncbi:MAG: VOC family protein [Chloroflexota bacterium]|nr:VOC family protein [Chloroflexota bacterium]